MTRTRRLFSISSGSMAASIHGRNAMDRLLATRALGFFDEVDHVFFPAGTRSTQEIEPGFRVHEVPGRAQINLPPGSFSRLAGFRSGWKEIQKLALTHPPSVLNATEPFLSGMVGLPLARKLGRPLVLTLVSNYQLSWRVGRLNPIPFLPPWVSFLVEGWVLSNADRIHTDCRHYADYAIARGAPSTKVRALPRYVDPFFYDQNPDSLIWEQLGIPGPPPLLYVGRLSPEKYAMELAEAFLLVADQDRERSLVVLGGGGPDEEAFLDRIKAGGKADRVHILTGLSRPQLLSAMGCAGVVLATHAGYALLEEALAGAKVIAFDYEWHPELIQDRVTGRLVPYRDPRAMAHAALELLSHPQEADVMARALRNRAEEGFRPKQHLSLLRESYREVLRAWDREANLP